MGRRAHVQSRHAEYDKSVSLSDWGQSAAAEYLCERGLDICTESEMIASNDADRWEIQLPWTGSGKRAHVDFAKMERIVRDLRKKPTLVTNEEGTEYGKQLADVLEAGVKAAKKHGYEWIIIDWW